MKKLLKISIPLIITLFALFLSACSFSGASVFGERKKYTVNFRLGENIISTQTVEKASSLTVPEAEERRGYNFVGWKNVVGAILTDDFGLSEPTDFFANYEIINYPVKYVLDGGTNSPENRETYTVNDSFTLKNPQKENCVFLGWEKDGAVELDFFVEEGQIGELIFTALWGDEGVSYLYHQGSLIPSQSGVFETPPKIEEKVGYEVEKFTVGGEEISFPYTPSKQLTVLETHYKLIDYMVSFVDGGNLSDIPFTVETETFSIPIPKKPHHEFLAFDDGEGEYTSYEVKKGTAKNLEITVKWTKIEYILTFDSFGGSPVEAQSLTYLDPIEEPVDPEREGYEFIGWYTDPVGGELFDFLNARMEGESFTLYARWFSVLAHALTYESDGENLVVGNFPSGSKLNQGENVSLSAKHFSDEYLFSHWEKDGSIYSFDLNLDFEMPDGNFSVKAVYKSINAYFYDKSAPRDLSVSKVGESLGKILGNQITVADYGLSSGVIYESFLSSLEVGEYLFAGVYSGGEDYFTVKVQNGEKTIDRVDIDYDLSYPKVTLNFKCDENLSYEYSLNGGEFKEALDGVVLEDYDKTRSNEIRVRNVSNHEDFATYFKAPVPSIIDAENIFSYGGETYDFIIESYDEFKVLLSYFSFVYAPLNFAEENHGGYVGVSTLSYSLSAEFLPQFGSAGSELHTKFFRENSVGYAPGYSSSLSGSKGTSKIFFTSLTPNKVVSREEKEIVPDLQKLLKPSSRESSFNAFPIDSFEKTQEIRTVYELENLPFGVKPVFTENSGRAYALYEKAREILREICDDNMNDYQKAVAVYDYIALNVTYDYEVSRSGEFDLSKYSAFTSYGALVDGLAVCDGMASAMKLMLAIEGIYAFEVSGTAQDGTSFSPVGHAWLKAEIGGRLYGFDPTWARRGEYVYHAYAFMDDFSLLSTGHFENAHGADVYVNDLALPSADYYGLSACHLDADYLVSTALELSALLDGKRGEGATVVEFLYTGSLPFETVLSQAIKEECLYSSLGNGVYAVIYE